MAGAASRQGPWHVPSRQQIKAAEVNRFRLFINSRHNLRLTDFWALHSWTVANITAFWDAVWDFSGIVGDKGSHPVFDGALPMFPTRHLSPSARVSWAENMLRSHPNARSGTRPAVVALVEPEDERAYAASAPSGKRDATLVRALTFADLEREVAHASEALRSWGVGRGDAVAGYISNNAEAIVMVLAANAAGALWSSSAPEVAPPSVLDRFEQIRPKVMVVVDRYRHSGRTFDMGAHNAELAAALRPRGLERIVVVGQLEKDREPRGGRAFEGLETSTWNDLLAEGRKTGRSEPRFERMPLNQPLWCLYSSGTTGKPKAIVHSQGGMLLASKMANGFHYDLGPTSLLLQATTTSWMMWNHMVSALGNGSGVISHDGSPLHPRSLFWNFTEIHKVSALSISPRYLQILLGGDYHPNRHHDLSSLTFMMATGAPLKPELYDFVKDSVKPLFLCNGSGGTDICSAFVTGCPAVPIYRGEISVPVLGMRIQAFADDDDDGNENNADGGGRGRGRPLPAGETGELVCSSPFPNAPLTFLGPGGEGRYRAAYFDHWPGGPLVWRHGDFVQITPRGGTIIWGRSDGVLNPSGVRFGSAELYAVVEEMKAEIDDCLAVGQKTPDGDERVLLFLQMQKGKRLTAEIKREVAARIADRLSRRHVPALILECPELPMTSNYKRMEVPVKKLVNGTPLDKISTASMSNPDTLKFFANNPDLAFAPPVIRAKL